MYLYYSYPPVTTVLAVITQHGHLHISYVWLMHICGLFSSMLLSSRWWRSVSCTALYTDSLWMTFSLAQNIVDMSLDSC